MDFYKSFTLTGNIECQRHLWAVSAKNSLFC